MLKILIFRWKPFGFLQFQNFVFEFESQSSLRFTAPGLRADIALRIAYPVFTGNNHQKSERLLTVNMGMTNWGRSTPLTRPSPFVSAPPQLPCPCTADVETPKVMATAATIESRMFGDFIFGLLQVESTGKPELLSR